MIVEVRVGDRPISYSAYNLYVECPKQFQLKREIGVPETPGIYLAGGDAVHIITAVLDLLLVDGERTRETAIDTATLYASHPGLAVAFEEMTRDE